MALFFPVVSYALIHKSSPYFKWMGYYVTQNSTEAKTKDEKLILCP